MCKRSVGIIAVLSVVMGWAGTAIAGPFAFTPRDLMLCFRQAGATSDLEVNIGQASLYYNATPGATFTVAGFTSAQLNAAFGTPFANVNWSVSGAVNTTGDATYPKNTMWVTAPRTEVNVQSSPWTRASSTIQGNSVSPILSISGSAANYSSSISPSANNTATAVLVPDGDALSYHSWITDNGNLGAFQGSIENLTSATFTASEVSRSDLYQIKPGNGAATYLGYFDFLPNGTVTFTAAGGVAPPPLPSISITNITVQIGTNGTVNASFPVTLSTNYTSTVSVNYATQDGTAVAGTDYTATSGTLSFSTGQTNLTITVAALGRQTFKDKVNFTLLLSSPTNGTLSVTQATGTIVDNFLPVIQAQAITRINNSSIIAFPSFSGVSYTLRYTNMAGLLQPISTWPIVNASVNGSGSMLSLTNTAGDTSGVYVLQGTRLP